MSSEWRTMTLNQAGVILIDCDHKTPKAVDHGQPYIGIPQLKNGRISLEGARLISAEDFSHWRRKALPMPNDVILSRRCNPGETAYVPEGLNIALGQNLVLLRATNENVYPPFLRWLAQGPAWWTQVNNFINVGAVFDSLKCADIPNFLVCLPPYNEQIKISEILYSLDKRIQINEFINQTLEKMVQALFKSWFVDFEPVKAKMAVLEAGGSQEEATLAAMTAISGKNADALAVFEREHPEQYAELKATAELFPSAMQDSELGEIPEGWKLQPFGELLSHTIGGDWGKDEPDDKHKIPVRIIRGTDIPNIKSCQDGNVPFRYVEEKKLKARSLNAGDIVIEVSGGSPTQPTGRSIYITDDILKRLSLPVEPASFCRLFRPKSMELGMILGLHLEKIYQDGKTWLYQNQSTGISNFQTKVFLENEMVAIASSEVLKAFYKVIFPFIKLIHSSENIKLTQLRDTLLPKLLSGKITLPEAEQIISEEA
ncbi:restriction endonuclease subunit S [Salmonella enterica]